MIDQQRIQVIGHGAMVFHWPHREQQARQDYHYCTANRAAMWPQHPAAHPMTFRWKRAP